MEISCEKLIYRIHALYTTWVMDITLYKTRYNTIYQCVYLCVHQRWTKPLRILHVDAGICSSHTTLDFSDAGGAGITIADFEPLFATGADRNLGPVLLSAPGFYPVLCNRLSSQVRRPGRHAVSEDDCYFTSRSNTSIIEIASCSVLC